MRHSINLLRLFALAAILYCSTVGICLARPALGLAPSATEVNLASATAWTFKPDGSTTPAKTISVPAGGWRLNGFPDDTAGTYERRVEIPVIKGQSSQVTVLDFEAVNWEAIVSVGSDEAHLTQAAVHLSAWTPFRVDISRLVTPGAQTLIHVHVRDRSYFKDAHDHFTVPAGPEWNDRAGRGILRALSLKVFPRVYLEDLFVHPSTQSRTFSCTASVRNSSQVRQEVTLSAKLSIAANGTARSAMLVPYPAIHDSIIVLEPGETRNVILGPVKWPLQKSMDWWPNIPYRPDYSAALHLITVSATASKGNGSAIRSGASVPSREIASVHTLQVRFGFCTMAQEGKRYTVNGVPINLRGDSLPESTIGTDAFARLSGFLPPVSDRTGSRGAIKCSGWPGAVRNYQRLNYNVIRMHQIPCTRYMMDVCDELGMLVIPETAIRGGGVAPENVAENPNAFTTHLRELILRDRNHPCVMKWSLENELPKAPLPFLRKLYDTCMQTDGTRPCSIDVFDGSDCPDWPNFAVIDHYTQPAGTEDAVGGIDRGNRPHGEGEYVWPNGAHPQGPVWFALETRDMRRHDNSDLRPYTLIDVWPSVIPLLSPTNFPDPHTFPDSLEQGGRSLLNPEAPWSHPLLALIQRSFAPLAAFDVDYDRLNMNTNGRGEWPARIPTVPGGSTVSRRLEVFNDDLSGNEVKLVFFPALRISQSNVEPLPETTLNLHIAPGGHLSVTVPLPAPPVARCTPLEATITLWKGGQERYRETLLYVVNPNATGKAIVDFVGSDTTTLGEWVDSSGNRIYGQQAFLLPHLGGRIGYQEPAIFLARASAIIPSSDKQGNYLDNNSDAMVVWDRKTSTDDKRVPWSGVDKSAREPVAFSGHDHRLLFRIECSDTAPHQVSLYLMDYKREGMPVDIDVYDIEGHRLDSRKVDGNLIDAGVYEKYRITGSIYIVLESLTTTEPVVSGLFVDPAK